MQRDLFALGVTLADPRTGSPDRVTKAAVTAEDIDAGWNVDRRARSGAAAAAPFHPRRVDRQAGAALHVARTVCRRAERAIVALGATL